MQGRLCDFALNGKGGESSVWVEFCGRKGVHRVRFRTPINSATTYFGAVSKVEGREMAVLKINQRAVVATVLLNAAVLIALVSRL